MNKIKIVLLCTWLVTNIVVAANFDPEPIGSLCKCSGGTVCLVTGGDCYGYCDQYDNSKNPIYCEFVKKIKLNGSEIHGIEGCTSCPIGVAKPQNNNFSSDSNNLESDNDELD